MRLLSGYIPPFILVLALAVPAPVSAQWVQTNGPYGGNINCVAATGNALFAGTNTGLYRSTDHGQSWLNVSETDQYYSQDLVKAIAVSNGVIYKTGSSSIIGSTDNGATWPIGAFLGNDVSDFVMKDTILVTRSYSSLITVWKFAGSLGNAAYLGNLPGGGSAQAPGVVFQCEGFSGTNILVGSDSGLYISPDSGATWDKADSGITDKDIRSLAAGGGRIFVGTETAGVFCSTDGGGTWSPSNSGLTSLSIRTIAENGDSLLAATNDGGVFLSTDSGGNWVPVNAGLPGVPVNRFCFDGNAPVAGTDGCGVYSLNGTWSSINSGLSALSVSSFASGTNDVFAGTYGAGIFRSTDDGTSWVSADSGLTSLYINSLISKGNNLFAATSGGGIFKSTDDGTSWSAANSGIHTGYINSLAATNGAILAGTTEPPDTQVVVYSGSRWLDSGYVYVSTNDGNDWTTLDSGFALVHAIMAVDSDIYVAGVWGLNLSTDNGKTWGSISTEYQNPAVGVQTGIVLTLACVDSDVYAGTSGAGIFLTSDRGATWLDDDAAQPGTNYFLIVPAILSDGPELFAANNSYGSAGYGVYVSDSGKAWRGANSGFMNPAVWPNPAVRALTISNNTLIAGTDGCGIWKRPLSEMTDVRRSRGEVPSQFSLYQNYPNPFNPTTAISYQLSAVSHVTLKVYDVLGREVETLVDEVQKIGRYEVRFDGLRLASGVYFCRLVAVGNTGQEFESTKKLVLMK